MAWPNFFPDNCPPADAAIPNLKVYRFTKNNPPVESDFNSYFEDGKESSKLKLCQACGVSVYADLGDAIKMQGYIAGLRRMRIASSFLNSSHGRIKSTPSMRYPDCGYSHHTWWKIEGLPDPSSEFEVEVL